MTSRGATDGHAVQERSERGEHGEHGETGEHDEHGERSGGQIDGLGHISLVTESEVEFERTVGFYCAVGLSKVACYERGQAVLILDTDFTERSRREVWLDCLGGGGVDGGDGGGSGGRMTVKVRLVGAGDGAARGRDSVVEERVCESEADVRAEKNSFVLSTPCLEPVIAYLKAERRSFWPYPNIDTVRELYTIDPLGNLVGFTTKRHPFAHYAVTAPKPDGRLDDSLLLNIDPAVPKRRIAILTSGGDSPGMNAAVRSVVRWAIVRECEVFVVFEGYEGLVRGGDMIKQMFWNDVRGWLAEGGTLIGTARSKKFRERAGRLEAAKNLVLAGIEALIVCGGDGSLTGADALRQEWPSLIEELVANDQLTNDEVCDYRHLTIAGLVGSIDNDMSCTDATIGAYSSLHRICEAIDSIGSTALSHSRAFVIEVMGRHCGWLALMAGISTGADFIFIPECPPPGNWKTRICSGILEARNRGKRMTIVILAEGATDEHLEPITTAQLRDVLSCELHLDTRVTTLGHTQRGGVPCAFDRMLAILQGVEAVNAVLETTPDSPSLMIGISENKITRTSLRKAVEMTHNVTVALKEKNFGKAVELRDPEFRELYQIYCETTVTADAKLLSACKKSLRIAIIHIGAPAGGMNPATRAAARYCINHGHVPIAIHNGIPGLVRHDAAREITWQMVERWTTQGGSEIGTNRSLPDTDLGMTAWMFQRHKFDALLIIGGFEAYMALCQLYEARKAYPAFRIPMVCLPATISNNVPGTEFSLGTDTCLNSVIEYCDAIKQSASASRRRVFVVEVQGGHCGYIAVLSGLCVSALAVYNPEDGINLKMLSDDVKRLKDNFSHDAGENRAGKLFIRNEKTSTAYSTEVISSIIAEEAQGRFEARTAILGHAQQGGRPSPLDRVRANRLAVRCIQFLEEKVLSTEGMHETAESACVIGIQGAKINFSPCITLWELETDHVHRRPMSSWWSSIKRTSDILSGRYSQNQPKDETGQKKG